MSKGAIGDSGRIATIAAVGVLLAVALGTGIYYSDQGGKSALSSGSSVSVQPFAASNNTVLANLALGVSLNSTLMNGNEIIAVNVNETNLVSKTLNVTANKGWHDDLPSGRDMPNEAYFPISVEVFRGYYTFGNVSSGTPLVFSTSARDIVCCDRTPDEYFLFNPSSSYAHLQQNSTYTNNSIYCPVTCLGPTNLPISYDLKLGPCCYYNSPYDTSSFALPAGTYTVKVYDMWGRVILAHFAVTNSITTVSSTSSETSLTRSTSSGSA